MMEITHAHPPVHTLLPLPCEQETARASLVKYARKNDELL